MGKKIRKSGRRRRREGGGEGRKEGVRRHFTDGQGHDGDVSIPQRADCDATGACDGGVHLTDNGTRGMDAVWCGVVEFMEEDLWNFARKKFVMERRSKTAER